VWIAVLRLVLGLRVAVPAAAPAGPAPLVTAS
jgi:hypothetical protein